MTQYGMSRNEDFILRHDKTYQRFSMQRIQEAQHDLDQLEAVHVTDGQRHYEVMVDKWGSWEQMTKTDSRYKGMPIQRVDPDHLSIMIGLARWEGWLL